MSALPGIRISKKGQRNEPANQAGLLDRTIKCPHGCKATFRTLHWRNEHVRRFHFHLWSEEKTGA